MEWTLAILGERFSDSLLACELGRGGGSVNEGEKPSVSLSRENERGRGNGTKFAGSLGLLPGNCDDMA